MLSNIQIGQHSIGPDRPPFIVAELSANHNGSLDRAKSIIDAIADAGAPAVKLQTYSADDMTIRADQPDFLIDDPNSLWHGRNLYDLYQEASTPWEWHEPLFEHAKKRNLLCFSTPFSPEAVDALESLDAPAYKIASFECNHIPLLKRIGKTGKPVILSTGMANVAELSESVETLRSAGCHDLILLKCTSTYPAQTKNSHLRTIPHLRDLFHTQVGLSDHTPGIGAAVCSVAFGATLIEKHVTLSRADGGVDSAFSLEPEELARLGSETKSAWEAIGQIAYGTLNDERPSLKFRRSLYIAENMKKGEAFTTENLRVIRPGYGLHPRHYELALGQTIQKDTPAGTPLQWEHLLDG